MPVSADLTGEDWDANFLAELTEREASAEADDEEDDDRSQCQR